MSGPQATSPEATSSAGGATGPGDGPAWTPRSPPAVHAVRLRSRTAAAVVHRSGNARSVVTDSGVLRHLHEELDVRAGLAQLLEQQVDGLLVVQSAEHAPELDHHRVLVGRHEQLFLARARVT